MILFIELLCTAGHENAGAAVEFPGPEATPPASWVEDHCKAFLANAREQPVLNRCLVCQEPQSGAWQVKTSTTTFTTLAAAKAELERIRG